MVDAILMVVLRNSDSDSLPLETTNLVLRSLKFVTDLYVHFLFLVLFKFFVSLKSNGSEENKLSATNKLMIAWIIFLWLLTFVQTLTLLTDAIGDYLQYKDIYNYEDSELNFLIWTYGIIVAPLRDLAIACSFAYLYYY